MLHPVDAHAVERVVADELPDPVIQLQHRLVVPRVDVEQRDGPVRVLAEPALLDLGLVGVVRHPAQRVEGVVRR